MTHTRTLLAVAALLSTTLSSGLEATTINLGGSETNLQTILDNVTVGGSSSIDVNADQVAEGIDAHWSIASDEAVASIMIELAGYKNNNTFGVYDASDPSSHVELFAGSDSAGDSVRLEIGAGGEVVIDGVATGTTFGSGEFGYYFNTPQGTFYSDTGLNGDGFDHMVAFQGNGADQILLPGMLSPLLWTSDSVILGLEDLRGGGDRDYNDMVVFIKGVRPTPAPEPGTLALLGAGVAALAGAARKRRSRAAA